ncbi:hypothetical protein JX265_013154 [Neoarthrinium moseri]|uniref:Digeranylgeranylglyceryl phosphate synthase n=1 Tax=Neoarthrinium moseri TaxID=1658444 RepID=A0A9Q0AHX1_9PEZI|nr:hypothetical protein JX266_012584 [Neoarthrinium moseri]KAI1851797.1 hypothetical protein JX265_013154 [Neoarthrinium moseri]
MEHTKQAGRDVSSRPKARVLYQAYSFLKYHAYTAYLLSCNNIFDIIVSGFLFGLINAPIAPRLSLGPSRSWSHLLKAAPGMLLWSWSNLAIFNLHNQRHGAEEDAVNKPWRPLPSKRLTPAQATWAMYCMYPVILGISWKFGGLGPCLLEAISCIHYNEWGGSSDPFLKNLLNGVGFACFLGGPLEVATGHSLLQGKAAIWMAILAASITTMSHAQDFRDKEGDRMAGRKTVPLIIGDTNARVLVAAGVLGGPAIACWFWQAGWSSLLAWLAGGAMSVNFFRDRSQKGDTLSWRMFPLWLLGMTLIPLGGF